jgi:hypothetical protein
LEKRGQKLGVADLPTMDAIWNQVKRS